MTGSADQAAARLQFLETAYAWELPEHRWLEGMIGAAVRLWGERPKMAYGYVYDASDVTRFQPGEPVCWGDDAAEMMPWVRFGIEGLRAQPPELITGIFRSVPVGFGRPLRVDNSDVVDAMHSLGFTDIFALNGLDPSGKGCIICLGVNRTDLSEQEIILFQRLSCHLSSAYRCRRRIAESSETPELAWEALLGSDGRLLEARGEAKGAGNRDAIQRATVTREDLRRHRDDGDPVSGWPPRIQTRWTLLDIMSKEGEKVIVARENQAVAAGLAALTDREREVVASAATGKTDKEIGYDLGISHATVRVLLGRARIRLGVRTQQQLLELPAIKALRGHRPSST